MLLRLMVMSLTLATVQTFAFGQGPAAADAMPSRERIAAASAQVREVFAADTAAAKTPQQKAALAQTMLSLAQETQDPAEAYVLLENSRKMAIDAKDARTMDRATKTLQARYRIHLAKERREALLSMAKTAPLDGLGFVVDALIADAESLKQAGRLVDATELAKAATVAARRGRDAAKQKQTMSLLDELKVRSRDQAVIQPALDKLAQNPRDAAAALEVGKHRCFVEDNWDAGLPLLAMSSDRTLAQLARADLDGDESSASHSSLGDAWFAYHEKSGSKQLTGGVSRARYHYEQALTDAAGLERAKITKRLEAIASLEGPGGGGWTVVFRSADPSIWNTDSSSDPRNYAMPLANVPATVRYLRIKRGNGAAVIVPMTKNMLDQYSQAGRYGFNGKKTKSYSATLLGIVDITADVAGKQGQVAVYERKPLSGWGFGVVILSGAQGVCWGGSPIAAEPLEIGVLNRGLTPEERKFLLE